MDTNGLRDLLKEHTTTPPTNADRHHEIERRVRGIRRRRAVGAGVAAASGVAVIALASSLLSGVSGARDPVASGPGGKPRSSSENAKPPPDPKLDKPERPDLEAAEELWPDAVHILPAKLPNGKKYEPVGFTDDRTVIVTTNAGFEQVGTVWRYDVDTGQASEVTAVPIPPGLDAADKAERGINLPDDFTIGGGRVAWWLGYDSDATGEDWTVEIWSAPLTGGPAQRVSMFQPPEGRGAVWALLAVANDQVIWSGTGGEVFAAPLGGGTARRIGPAGSQLVAWPWIGSPSGGPPSADGQSEPDPNFTHYQDLRDVVTGERRPGAHVAGNWSCGVEWCLGTTLKGDAVRRRDSTRGRLLPDEGQDAMGNMQPRVPLLDRFVVRVTEDGVYYVYDLRTGKGGLLSGDYDKSVLYSYGYPGERIYSKAFKGHQTVVNLAAIE